jgi:hypothetical protein
MKGAKAMRSATRWLIHISVCSTAMISSISAAQHNFVACPILRDTETVPCWLAESGGELYYIGIQGDVTEDFLPPYLGYKVLVEGTLTDKPRICGGIVLEPVRVSVMKDPDPSCNTMLPAEPRYTVPFAPRGPGPREVSAILRPRVAPPPLPQPPYGEREFVVSYDFDRQLFYGRGSVIPIDRALDYAEIAKAARIEVIGHRGAALLADGKILPEEEGIGEIRAKQVAENIIAAGYPREKLVVSWNESYDTPDGMTDYKKRRTTLKVIP